MDTLSGLSVPTLRLKAQSNFRYRDNFVLLTNAFIKWETITLDQPKSESIAQSKNSTKYMHIRKYASICYMLHSMGLLYNAQLTIHMDAS